MAPPTIDPLIRLRPTKNLLKVVSYLYTLKEQDLSDGVNSATPDGILSSVNGSPTKSQEILYSVEDIKWIYDRKKLLKDSENEQLGIENIDSLRNIHFHELISECDVILPEPKFPKRDPVLDARCRKLQAQQNEREYQKMTSNIDGRVHGLHRHGNTDSFSHQMKELNNYLLIVAQFVISLICSFAFGYLAPYYFYQTTEVGPRLLTGIIFAFVVALAELYFVLKFLLETEGVIVGDTIKSYDSSLKGREAKIKTN